MKKLAIVSERLFNAIEYSYPIDVIESYGNELLGAYAESKKEERIMITESLVRLLSEDELAFVIAHEITHLQQNHSEQEQRYIKNLEEAAKQFYQRKNEEMKKEGCGLFTWFIQSALLGVMSGITTAFMLSHEQREHEHEADKLAWHIMQKAGYNDFSAIESFFMKVRSGKLTHTFIAPDLFHSHPSDFARLQNILE